jgi:hypothetical protein
MLAETQIPAADGKSVMVRFVADRNLEAITYLHSRDATIDGMLNGPPMIRGRSSRCRLGCGLAPDRAGCSARHATG